MSRFSKVRGARRLAAVVMCGAFFGSAIPARAGAEPASPPATITTQDEGKSADGSRGYSDKLAVKTPAKAPASEFRCWQGGQMIFEARGVGPMSATQVAADLKAADGSTGRIQVLDMYEGLCILELPR